MRLILCLLALLFSQTAAAEMPEACLEQTPCALGERSYHLKLPDDWDGESAMPVLLHFHGWQRQGTLIVQHRRISGATRTRGVLLIAPNGRNRTWDFWRRDTDDVPFARAVLEDVAARYPIDRSRIYVSGYSFGSAMAWRFACEDGNDVTALLAISGTLPQDEYCPASPAEIRHVHGTTDTVMDFPFGPGGDETYPVALWREKWECGAPSAPETWSAVSWLELTRRTWDCADGRRVTLDVHGGGHFIPRGWIAHQLDELLPASGS